MRNLVWVALALAVGTGAVLLLSGDDEESGYELDGGPPEDGETAAGAALEGTGTAIEADVPIERPTGSARIRGIVIDLSGKPVIGVALELATPRRPTWRPWSITREIDLSFAPPEYAVAPFAETTSGADGTFLFRDIDPRRMYTLHALPAAGRCGNRKYIGTSDLRDPVTIVVSPGAPLSVRTVDASGTGIPAWVEASLPNDGASAERPMGRDWRLPPLRSDSSGDLTLPAVPEGELVFSVFVPGVGRRAGITVGVPHDGVAILALGDVNGGSVRGKITNTAGEAVAGARVLVMGYPGESKDYNMRISRTARTAADGSYLVDGFPAGRLQTVMISADGYLYVPNATSEKPLAAAAELVVDATLYRGGVISGRVHDPEGIPVADATLLTGFIGNRFNASNIGRATSDSEGRFKMENVSLGSGRLAGWAPGHYTQPDASRRSHWWISVAGVPFELKEEGEALSLDLTLHPSLPVSGRVVDAEGTGVGGVLVEAKGSMAQGVGHFNKPALQATTDAEGRFELAGLPPGSWQLHTTTSFGMSQPAKLVIGAGKPPPPVEIVLRPGATIRGRVEVDGHPPLEPVNVMLKLKAGRGRNTRSIATQAEGRFAFEGVAAGEYDLYVSGMFGQAAGEKEAVSVEWGAVRDDVVVTGKAVGSIRGIVVDTSGEPVAGVGVSLEYSHDNMNGSWQTSAGPDGRFTFRNLPEGKYKIAIAGSKQKHVAEPGPDELRLVRDEAEQFVIEGTVLAPDGKPVASGQVMVFFVKGGGMSGTGAIISGGSFRHEGAPQEGEIRLQITGATDALGRAIRAKPLTLMDYKPDGKPIEIQLESGLAIAGRVLDPAGAPVQGVSVRVRAAPKPGGHMWHMPGGGTVVTDAEGRFEAVGLGDGKHHVRIQDGGEWIAAAADTQVEAGRTDLELHVERGVRISGHVRAQGGEAVAGCTLYFYPNPDPDKPRSRSTVSAQTDGEGAFEFRGVPDGTAGRVVVNAPPDNARAYMGKTEKDVAAGTTGLVVVLEVGVFINGTVVGPAGEAVPGVSVQAQTGKGQDRRSYRSSWMDTGSKTFRVGPMAPGVYRVTARASGDYKNSEPVDVRAPASGVKLVVPKGNPLKGRVLGEGIDGFQVRFQYATANSQRSTSARVGTDGSFRISVDDDVTGLLFASKTGDTRYALLEEVRPQAGPVTVTLQEGKRISGRVENLDPDAKTRYSGGGVANMRLKHASGFYVNAIVKADGAFEALGCPDGSYVLTVGQGRRRAELKSVEAGTSGVVLRLVEK